MRVIVRAAVAGLLVAGVTALIGPAAGADTGGATHLVLTAPATATAGVAFQITVTAEDDSNAVTPGYTQEVSFGSSDSLAVLPASYTFLASDNGVHQFTVTLKHSGGQSIDVTDPNTPVSSGNANVTVAPGPTTTLQIGTPAKTSKGELAYTQVNARDAFGNSTPDYRGTDHFTSTDPAAHLNDDITFQASDDGGHGAYTVMNTPGTQTLTATDITNPSIKGTSAPWLVIDPGPADHIDLGAPASVSPGAVFTLYVDPLDKDGNQATTYTGTLHFTSTDPAAQLPSDHTFQYGEAGNAYIAMILNTPGPQTVTVTDTVNPALTKTSTSIAVTTPGGVSHFGVGTGANATTGQTLAPGVEPLDPSNQVVASYRGTIHYTSSDPLATLPADYTFTAHDAGQAFPSPLVFQTPGDQSITVTDTADPGITGTTTVHVTSAAVADFRVTAAATVPVGQPVTLDAVARDASNTQLVGYTGTVHATSSDGAAVLPADTTFQASDGGDKFIGPVTFSATGSQTVTLQDTANGAAAGQVTINVTAADSSGPPTWTQPAVTGPSYRLAPAMGFDRATNQILLFGGNTFSKPLGETWSYTAVGWTQLNPATAPSPRDNSGMAFDAASNQMIMFGGGNDSGPLGETWQWTGTDWTLLAPAHSPAPRGEVKMAYDAALGKIILFGGAGDFGYANDTWAWDGTDWTQLSPTGDLPPARASGAVAYDAQRQRIVLFGGEQQGTRDLLNDTWTFDGTAWTHHTPTSSPPVRADEGLAYDTLSRTVVMEGGDANGTYLGDTWAWDGTNWTQLGFHTSPTPPGRSFAGFADDTHRDRLVLFGGFNGGTRKDTWEFTGATAAAPAVTTNPKSQTVAQNASVTLTAAATGIPTPTVQWQRSTDGGTTFTDLSGATTTTLTFTATAGAKFRAVFTNPIGSATTSVATITVQTGTKPVVTLNPKSTAVVFGATASFSAAASGTPTPTVQWQRSTDGTTFTNVSGATSTTLTATATVTAQYRAVFTNSAGTATTTAATLTVVASGGPPQFVPGPPSSTPPPGSGTPPVVEAGATRIETAIAISQDGFLSVGVATAAATGATPRRAAAVVLIGADDLHLVDSVAATPLAVHAVAPVLLTPADALDAGVQAEITRVLPRGSTVYIVGGTSAVSPSVDAALSSLGFAVVRLAGVNRFATAVAVATHGLHDPAMVFEANGRSLADAISAGAAAGVNGAAILLTDNATPAPDTTAYLAQHPGVSRIAVGGPAAAADPSATAVTGDNRYATTVAVATRFLTRPTSVGFASGTTFADGVAGGAAAARAGGPLLLTDPQVLPPEVAAYLRTIAASVTSSVVFGGDAAVSPAVRQQIAAALAH